MSEVDDKLNKIKDEFKDRVDEQNFFLMESLKSQREKLDKDLNKKIDSKLKKVEDVYGLVSTVKESVDQKQNIFRKKLDQSEERFSKLQQDVLKKLSGISDSQTRFELDFRKSFFEVTELQKKLSERVGVLEKSRQADKQALSNRIERELKKLEKLKDFEAGIESIKAGIKGLGDVENVKIEKLGEGLKSTRQDLAVLRDSIASLQGRISELNSGFKAGSKELDDKLDKRLNAFSNEFIVDFSSKFSKIDALNSENRQLSKEFDGLKESLNSVSEKIDEVVGRASETEKGFSELKENVIGRVNLQSGVQEENLKNVERVIQESSSVKNSLAELQEKFSSLNERLKSGKSLTSFHNKEIDSLKEELSLLSNNVSKLLVSHDSLVNNQDDYKEKFKKRSESIESLKNRIAGLEARLREELKKSQSSRASSLSKDSSARKALEARMARVQTKLAGLEKTGRKHELAFRKQVQDVGKELSKIKVFEKEINALDRRHSEKIAAAEARVKSLSNKAEASVRTIKQQAELLKKDRENVWVLKKTLEERVDSLIKQYSGLVEQVKKVVPDDVLARFEKSWQSVRKELDFLKEKLDLLSNDLKRFEEKTLLTNKSFEENVKETGSLQNALAEQGKTFTALIDGVKSEQKVQAGDLKNFSVTVKELKNRIEDLDEPLTSVESKFAEFNDGVKVLMTQNYANTIQMINEGDKAVRAELMKTIDSYKINSVKTRLQEIDSRLKNLESTPVVKPKDLQVVKAGLTGLIKEQVELVEQGLTGLKGDFSTSMVSELSKLKTELVKVSKDLESKAGIPQMMHAQNRIEEIHNDLAGLIEKKVSAIQTETKKGLAGVEAVNQRLSEYEEIVKKIHSTIKDLRVALKRQAEKLEEETDLTQIKELFE